MASTDEKVTTDLIETLEDGRKGFEHAAERLAESDRPDLGTKFTEFARQRASFSTELEKMAAAYGDDIDEDGSVAAAVHRGWMTVRDAISGADAAGVLSAALTGENHAVSEFEKALDAEISDGLRQVVTRQKAAIEAARTEVQALADAAG